MKKNKRFLLLLAGIIAITSCEEVLEKSLTDKKVALQAPVNNLTTANTVHTFYWQEMEGATQYQLQVVAGRFDSIVQLIADTTGPKLVFNIELEEGSYQWRVRAKNNSTVSEYSDTWNLTIQ